MGVRDVRRAAAEDSAVTVVRRIFLSARDNQDDDRHNVDSCSHRKVVVFPFIGFVPPLALTNVTNVAVPVGTMRLCVVVT